MKAKSINVFWALLPVFLVLFIACDQTAVPESIDQGISVIETRANHKIEVTCNGAFEPGEHPFDPDIETCGAMLYDGKAKTIECPHSECSMTLSSGIEQYLSPSSDYLTYFNEHLQTKHGVEQVYLSSVEISQYEDAEVVLFNYQLLNSEMQESVMYVAELDDSGARIGRRPVIEVDCDGPCSDNAKTCCERYVLSTGNVECTCDGGGCAMTISEKGG